MLTGRTQWLVAASVSLVALGLAAVQLYAGIHFRSILYQISIDMACVASTALLLRRATLAARRTSAGLESSERRLRKIAAYRIAGFVAMISSGLGLALQWPGIIRLLSNHHSRIYLAIFAAGWLMSIYTDSLLAPDVGWSVLPSKTLRLAFSFRGRSGRANYWVVTLVASTVLGIGIALGVAPILFGAPPGASIALIVIPPLALCVTSLLATVATALRRLHDRDMSAWWLLMFYLAPSLLSVSSRTFAPGPAQLAFRVGSFGITAWSIIELGCLRGTPGPNPYGPDPLEHSA